MSEIKENNSENSHEKDKEKTHSRKNLIPHILVMYMIIIILAIIVSLFFFIGERNPEIFILSKDTIIYISNTVNTLQMLSIPFVFGCAAATVRILISDLNILRSSSVILASGGVAAFSWIGIKSKVFIALLAPYLATKEQVLSESLTNGDITEYYSMVFIAIIVGMFASNIVIFIENKTKMLELTAKIKNK